VRRFDGSLRAARVPPIMPTEAGLFIRLSASDVRIAGQTLAVDNDILVNEY